MSNIIKFLRGAEADIPVLNQGEPAFTTDTHKVFIGDGAANYQLAMVADKLSVFAATTSAELAGVISDETGSGLLVFGTSPTITTPVINHKVTAKTTTATLNIAESGLITVIAASGYTILLPTAVGNSGIVFTIKKTDDNANLITIDGDGTETIDGALTYTDINYQYAYVIIVSDNANWLIIGESTVKGGTF